MFEPVVSDSNLSGTVDYNPLTGGVSLQTSDLLTPIQAKVNQGMSIAEDYLRDFLDNSQFTEQLELAFGNEYDPQVAANLAQQWANDDFSELPDIQILSSEVLGGANGAFAASRNTIYLSQEFVQGEDLGGITSVILEEIGHSVDWEINRFDAAGDEGDIFSHLVQGNSLSGAELAALKGEDDSEIITVDGIDIVVELSKTFGTVNLKSFNFPDYVIRHQNSLGEISRPQSQLDYQDAAFNIVPGLADPNAISFESVNYPGYFLRHENYRIKLAPMTDTQLFKADATFYQVQGLANSQFSSFRSYNFPNYYIRHQNSHLYIGANDGSNLFKNDASFDAVTPQNVLVNLKSFNFPDYAIRHQNSLGEISRLQSQLDYQDAAFKIVRGLADPNAISFESTNYPGYFLRHENYRIKLAPMTDTQLFKADATFYQVQGLANSQFSSFRSYNFPNYYIRHQNSHLYIGANDGGNLFKSDASFDVIGNATGGGGSSSGLMATSSYLTQLQNGSLLGKSSRDVDSNGTFVCWDLVADATGLNSSNPNFFTNNWKKGENVMANGKIATGTAIATFLGPNGAYDNPIYNSQGQIINWIQHTAIFAEYGNGGFWVWDQNWGLPAEPKYIKKHFISTSGSNVSNANNYFVIKA